MSDTPGPGVEKALEGLKDFQRNTVEYVFRRLYTESPPTRRFLIADEVGLGKTLVARGVIARAIEHLWERVERIDVIYICSNAEIARQNINRLLVRVPGMRDVPLASRIGLLPAKLSDLQGNKVNFISLTPGTSFDLKSSLGQVEERGLLYRLLVEAWDLSERSAAPEKVLQGGASLKRFRQEVAEYRGKHIDPTLTGKFMEALADHGGAGYGYRSRFEALCEAARHRKGVPRALWREQAQLVGELRRLLAESCIEALEPDLIVLDEFQRFKHLLNPGSEGGALAQRLFQYTDGATGAEARVLLMSATPYKMYTVSGEAGDDDHYRDFVKTLQFLVDDEGQRSELERLLGEYRRELYRLGDRDGAAGAVDRLRGLKSELEERLRRVMVRTERLAVSEDRKGMLVQVPSSGVRLEARDLASYVALEKVSGLLSGLSEGRGTAGADLLEYWKTAPYLLNFMEARNYKLKQTFQDMLGMVSARASLASTLAGPEGLLFPWNEWSSYREIDPQNARLRALLADTVGAGAWRLLWVPPSLPYYALDGPFAEAIGFTKRLIFSGWNVVPKVLSSLLSYEVERQMVRSAEADPGDPASINRWRRPLLRFARAEGRLTGMPILGLLYPSVTLANEGDPLVHAGRLMLDRGAPAEGLPSLDEVLQSIEAQMAQLLHSLDEGDRSGPPDESWYWAAPILLDLRFDPNATVAWFSRPDLASKWNAGDREPEEDGEESRWAEHVSEARRLLASELQLGPRPADLARVLALLAAAAPGVAALRTLTSRAVPLSIQPPSVAVRDAAGRIGWAFRNLFNHPEVISLIRGLNAQEPYWRRVLEYCAAGGLQSVLDEYAHILESILGLSNPAVDERADALSEAMQAALRIRASVVGADEVDMALSSGLRGRRMRLRFAARYAADRTEDTGDITRPGQVRDAFNSPFWPFVLATTSIGQEGLDFHPYCHAVVHWDLPSNPVDLEQREGRVHRYKGHAVRKNLALRYRRAALAAATLGRLEPGRPDSDPWEYVFSSGKRDRPAGASDLIPFWVYSLEGGARVERHVPTLPLSRDVERLAALCRSLALYRMVFGQPRQEDLLAFLITRIPEDQAKQMLGELRIDLAPPKVDHD